MVDKKIVKELVSSILEGNGKHGFGGRLSRIAAAREIHTLLKEIADDFFREDVTVTISKVNESPQ